MKFNLFTKGCSRSQYSDRTVTLEELVHIDCDQLVDEYRRSKDRKIKSAIPAFCPLGTLDDGQKRVIQNMLPTRLVMIDLDHMESGDHDDAVAKFIDKCNWEKMVENGLVLAYITCSSNGIRLIITQYEGYDLLHSAVAFMFQNDLTEYLPFLDTVTTDLSRLSILTKRSEYIYYKDILTDFPDLIKADEETQKFVNAIPDIKSYISSLKQDDKDDIIGYTNNIADDNSQKPKQVIETSQDEENKPYKEYTENQVAQNDRMYAQFKYKGRLVHQIAEAYVSYKTNGMGPEPGERHSLYNMLCKNFRNLCNNDPRILHAVLPSLNHLWVESWKQCYYFTSVNKSDLLPKEFWFWLKNRGFLEVKTDDDDDEETLEDKMYNDFLSTMPTLPPIIRQFVNIAPKWFKLPVITSLQCYTALLSTNYRAYYFDGTPLSTTLYSLVYAPAASGKSYVRRLKTILESTEQRDTLAMNKAKWYDKQQRQNNGSGKLPEEVVWKQRLFASKTSLGEILKRQEAIGNHHWLQDVGEFSIWAATVKKNKEEWSAFFRTSYDNETFMQSYQSANAYRGKVDIYPIVHGTCTVGQIKSFFTNIEDGLLTRFSFVPLLHQRFASYQAWKVMSDKEQMIIDKVVERLDIETYKTVQDEEKNSEEWDYDFKEPQYYDMSFLFDPLLKWLEEKRLDAAKSSNEALDTFRKRCARNAFIYGIICRALWGKDDKKTRQKIIDNVLWDAEVKLFYMRYMWEDKMNKELSITDSGTGLRLGNVFEALKEEFTRSQLEQVLSTQPFKTPVKQLIYNWKQAGFIKETSKFNYKKVQK